MRPLTLHHLTALDVSPVELVTLAAESGCERIATWVHDPIDPFPGKGWPQFHFPSISENNKTEMAERLSDNGIKLANIEMFPIAQGIDVESYRKHLELGAELGAERAVVHVHDLDEARAVDSLSKFCTIAAEYGIGAGVEFAGIIDACKSLDRALYFVEAVDMPGLGVALDFLHVIRTGASVEEIRRLPRKYVSYAQICDGPSLGYSEDYLAEGLDRMIPGDGVWPLLDLINAIPSDIPIDVEVPLTSLKERGVTASERVSRAVRGARSILEAANPGRGE